MCPSPAEQTVAVASVLAVNRDDQHRFSKPSRQVIVLLEGLGVEGDSHLGVTVQHRSRVARDPSEPNLRQVHLIHSELFAELAGAGYSVAPGEMGENITTVGIDLLALSRGTRLHLGDDAVIEITGLRDPCEQLNGLARHLMKQVLLREPDGTIVRKAGIMSVVVHGGTVKPGDGIRIEAPAEHVPLQPV
ncbi:MOSC domain-containing protein [Rathayibacter soli]|uniref:MOSC domain-containing protein n=1 Tax=Rathayibacter soli TaxID=3144168 RepID=UPI0027E45528|nr:MOSC domain-containing protein [Glaciibacter superstes]